MPVFPLLHAAFSWIGEASPSWTLALAALLITLGGAVLAALPMFSLLLARG